MTWKTKLQIFVILLMVAGYLAGYVNYRRPHTAWAKQAQPGVPEPRADGVAKILFKPMEFVAKLAKDTPVDVNAWVDRYDKTANPDGPAMSEEELSQRFIEAHKEANIRKIRQLFYNNYLPDDDIRQIGRLFDYGIARVMFTDLPPGTTAHSNFEGEMAVTRMMIVYYITSPTMLPSQGRFYVGKKDERYFLMIRWAKG